MRLLKRLCPPLALMLVLTLVPFVAGSRPAAAAAPTLGPVFNDTDRWAISKNITRMVKATPRGATIRIAQYRIASSDPHLLPALHKAVKRGVNVRIVLDKSDRNRHPMRDEGLAKLAALIKKKYGAWGNRKVGTSVNHRTIIRIAVWGFTREEVARKLRSLADRDCWIDVAINKPGEVSAEVLRLLANHPRINVDDARSGGRWMHAKYLLVEGNYAGRPDSKLAFVGSHNFTLNALRHNDETWLKIDRASVHDAFRANFRRIMKASPNYPL